MAVSAADRAVIASWSGVIDSDDEEMIDERLQRLGNAYAVALEILMETRATMAVEAGISSSADDRTSHVANVAWVDDQISRLVGFLSTSEDITLGTAAQALLDSAPTAEQSATVAIAVTADNRRRA